MKEISMYKRKESKMRCLNYPSIDAKATGALIKKKMLEFGYSVKELQHQLYLACPQTIYRWFQGQKLPSLAHLYQLSKLFGVHMEELLVVPRVYPILTAVQNKNWKQRWALYKERVPDYFQLISE